MIKREKKDEDAFSTMRLLPFGLARFTVRQSPNNDSLD